MARRMLGRDPGAMFLFISSRPHQDPLLERFVFLAKPFESATLLRAVAAAVAHGSYPPGGQASSRNT
jgi:hypothetical protein